MLGQGAFGQVFLCYDSDHDRELAVKLVPLASRTSELSKVVDLVLALLLMDDHLLTWLLIGWQLQLPANRKPCLKIAVS